MQINEYNWVGQRLLEKYDYNSAGAAQYVAFIQTFSKEIEDVFLVQTRQKLTDFCQKKLSSIVMTECEIQMQEFQLERIVGRMNPSI